MARCSVLFLLVVPAVLGLLVPSCMGDNILYQGQSLYLGQSLNQGQSPLHLGSSLVMQPDCNLVLYDSSSPGQAIWASDTVGDGLDCRVTMQSDGHLVIYTGSGDEVWASDTIPHPAGNYVLILEDRNLGIYDLGPAIWAPGTNAAGTLAKDDLGNKH